MIQDKNKKVTELRDLDRDQRELREEPKHGIEPAIIRQAHARPPASREERGVLGLEASERLAIMHAEGGFKRRYANRAASSHSSAIRSP